LEGGEVNIVKKLNFENGGGGVHEPPSSYGGTTPGPEEQANSNQYNINHMGHICSRATSKELYIATEN